VAPPPPLFWGVLVAYLATFSSPSFKINTIHQHKHHQKKLKHG